VNRVDDKTLGLGHEFKGLAQAALQSFVLP
jgi:hypothetical protein